MAVWNQLRYRGGPVCPEGIVQKLKYIQNVTSFIFPLLSHLVCQSELEYWRHQTQQLRNEVLQSVVGVVTYGVKVFFCQLLG